MLLEIYWGTSCYNYVRRQEREKREDGIFQHAEKAQMEWDVGRAHILELEFKIKPWN